MPALVTSSGSSSIKYKLINPSSGEGIASGLVERIGEETGHIRHEYDEEGRETDGPVPGYTVGMETALSLLKEIGPSPVDRSVKAAGHHVVQGGGYFDGLALVDGSAEARIGQLCSLDSFHNPVHLTGIRVACRLLPNVPHVVAFNTTFFQSLLGETATYAVDREIAEKHEIRRYGAHGTPHQYVSGRISEALGYDDLRQIVLHIGDGASVSTVVSGSTVKTSIGFTPFEDLVVGTRIGGIDPVIVFHLARAAGMDVDKLNILFNRGSGLKDLTGQNGMRTTHILATEGDENTIGTLTVYVHRTVKYIGTYATVVGGSDAITFTVGAGENDVDLRADVIGRLTGFDMKISADLNTAHSKEPRILSAPDSTVVMLVIPTSEELAIARQAMSLVERSSIEAELKLRGKLGPESKLRSKGGTRQGKGAAERPTATER